MDVFERTLGWLLSRRDCTDCYLDLLWSQPWEIVLVGDFTFYMMAMRTLVQEPTPTTLSIDAAVTMGMRKKEPG